MSEKCTKEKTIKRQKATINFAAKDETSLMLLRLVAEEKFQKRNKKEDNEVLNSCFLHFPEVSWKPNGS